jgi:hypothetical protein
MHGTADPVVPYEQSVGGLEVYVEAKYPLARLRSLDGWNHWPTQPQTEQQLAWCEGMTTADAGRLEAALTTLARAKDACDPVALRQVAARAASFAGMPEAAKKTAADAMAAVDAVASEHASAITKSAGKVSKDLVDKPWVGHLPLFLRHFRGIPACDEFAAQWASVLDSHAEASKKHGKGYWQDRERKPKEAFVAGVQWLQTAFLTPSTENEEMVAQLESWAADAKKLSLGKAELKAFQTVVPVVRAARDKGRKAFEKVDRRFR